MGKRINTKILEKELSYKIVGCFYAVYNKYGNGLKEQIYQKALAEEFNKIGLKFEQEKKINIYSLDTGKVLGVYRPDFIVENKIIVEVKATDFTVKQYADQQRSYLKAAQYEIAYLVNFGTNKLDIRRSIYTNDRKPFIRVNSSKIRANSFTLMELLIVIALTVLLATIAIVLLNPKKQLEKAWDTQRKYQLAKLQKVFEDYYNDNSAYPKDQNVCYDPVDQVEDSCFCHICGLSAENNFSPYLPRLFCDPQHPKKSYLYQYDCGSDSPSWYRICASLSDESNYSVASPNLSPGKCTISCPPDPQGKYCIKNTTCNNCGEFSNCIKPWSCNQPLRLYKDFSCAILCYSETPAQVPTPTQSGPTPTPPVGQPTTPPAGPTATPASCPADPQNKYCFKGTICNNCGSFSNCTNPVSCNQPVQLYKDFSCQIPCD